MHITKSFEFLLKCFCGIFYHEVTGICMQYVNANPVTRVVHFNIVTILRQKSLNPCSWRGVLDTT
jgi:hypothetical protein